MKDKKVGSFQSIGSVLFETLRAQGVAEGVERASVFPEWEELVGGQIARVASPTGFDRSTLFVEVRSSSWLMELEMMERRILARLNARRRQGKFERIVFRLSESGGHK